MNAEYLYVFAKRRTRRWLLREFRGDEFEADDLLHAAFVHYLAMADEVRHPWPYLLRSMWCRVVHRKREYRRFFNNVEDVWTVDRPDYSAEINGVIEQVLASDLLKHNIRAAFGHVRLRGVKRAEAARIMGRNKSSVTRALQRADRILQGVFRERGLDPKEMEPC